MFSHKRIYNTIFSVVDKNALHRDELIDLVSSKLVGKAVSPHGDIGKITATRSSVAQVLSEMLENGILKEEYGKIKCASCRYVALRAESLERKILELLQGGAKNKTQIRAYLEASFGTEKTATSKDDNTLYSLNGYVLSRLMRFGIVGSKDGLYYILPEKVAKLDDISEMIALKEDFLTRIHSRGGEFFEHYIMTLLGKYIESFGVTVTENRTTGGTADGGIDGIICTIGPLGFRERIMVQAKNRLELSNETTVRGFYGAVCAGGGSRGIFATTSDFHPAASEFLDGIDNCVGVNADMIFKMALKCQYGLKKIKGSYKIDNKII